jgi:hypothetical protein
MLDVNSVEQQVTKYAEEPVISWADDCECKKIVSAVADVLKKFITKKKDTKKSKQEATSGSNTKVDCETQIEKTASRGNVPTLMGRKLSGGWRRTTGSYPC